MTSPIRASPIGFFQSTGRSRCLTESIRRNYAIDDAPVVGGLMSKLRRRAPQIMAIVAGIYFVYYLWWRATETLNPAVWAFSLFVLAVEIYGFIDFVSFAFMTWDV